jgi:hypothetical protein
VNWSDFSPCFTLRAAFAALFFVLAGDKIHETVEVNPLLRNALRNWAKATIFKVIKGAADETFCYLPALPDQ